MDPKDKDNDNYNKDELKRQLEDNLKKFREQTGKTSSHDDNSAHSYKQHTEADDNFEPEWKTNSNNRRSDDNNNKRSTKAGFDSNAVLSKFKGFKLGGNSGKAGIFAGLTIAAVIFVFSGFYTVNESERGVVTRLGAYSYTSDPGLNWRIPLIDKVQLVNVKSISEIRLDGTMLTKDENVVNVSMNIQYRINDPREYLYNVDQPVKTLQEATESSLRYVVGHMNMDEVLTTGRLLVREDTRKNLVSILDRYQLGVDIVDVNFQYARPPEAVKEAFDDAIKAQEDEERYKREAHAYQLSREPIARGKAEQILNQAAAYAKEVVLQAVGSKAQFDALLPEFQAQPVIFKQRYYLDTLAGIYRVTPKVILQDGVNLNFLSLDKLLAPPKATPAGDGSLLLVPNNPDNTANSDSLKNNPLNALNNNNDKANYYNFNGTDNSNTPNSDSRNEPSRFATPQQERVPLSNRVGGN